MHKNFLVFPVCIVFFLPGLNSLFIIYLVVYVLSKLGAELVLF